MRQRRLLYIVNDVPFFLSHRLPIGRAARSEGFDVHVAGPHASAVPQLGDNGFIAHDLHLPRGVAGGALAEIRGLASIRRLFHALRPDLLHCVTLKPVLVAGAIARQMAVPAVVHALAGLGYSFTSPSMKARSLRFAAQAGLRYALKYPHALTIVQNPDDRAALLESGLVPPSQIALIRGSGVDLDVFHPSPESPGIPLVVLPSRMLWDKGVGEFVEAARLLRARGHQARFVLVGQPDPANPNAIASDQLDEWRRSEVVQLWGHRTDMPEVLRSAHIVCLPSYREGLPKVLIEAAACGRPIVTTDAPGCREIVRHGENGLLVPVRNAADLADAIEQLLGDPELRLRFGLCGREMAVAEFSEARVVQETLEVYRRALANSEPVSRRR